MRQAFGEFYGPREADLKRLIKEGMVVLDANVLLQAYELPKESREALLDTLERLKTRLWIPYQVGLEFQSRRLQVIARQLGELDGIIERAVLGFQKLQSEIDGLELHKQGVEVDDAGLKEGLAKAEAELRIIVGKTRASAAQVSQDDPIRERMDALFEGRVGPPPASQDAVEVMNEAAQRRYECAIPPGFKDVNKDRDPPKAGLYARGIRFERKYGDYYLWVQTLAHVRDTGAKAVLFVTSDAKRDWWQEVKDVTVGPLPALVREMQQEGGAELFWMYSLGRFLAQANEHLQANVSQVALQEVEESEAAVRNAASHTLIWQGDRALRSREDTSSQDGEALRAVAAYYQGRGFSTEHSAISTAIFASDGESELVIRVVPPSSSVELSSDDLVDAIATKISEVSDDTPPFSAIHVVVTMPLPAMVKLLTHSQLKRLKSVLPAVAKAEGIAQISVGIVNKSTYTPLYTHRAPASS